MKTKTTAKGRRPLSQFNTLSLMMALLISSAGLRATELLHWQLDETSGISAFDATGNGNTGSLINTDTTDRVAGISGSNGSSDGNGLVVYWNLDEGSGQTINDSAPEGSNGDTGFLGTSIDVESSDPSWESNGKYNACISNDIGYFLTVPNSSDLEIGQSGITVALWVKLDKPLPQFASVYPNLVGNQHWDTGTGWGFFIEGRQQLRFRVLNGTGDGGAHYTAAEIKTISANVWHHFAASWDRQYFKIYVDGVKQRPKDVFYNGGYIPNNLDIQIAGGPGGGHFEGDLDEIRIYNYALSETDVENLYLGVGVNASEPESASAGAFEVYPNPTSESLIIEGPGKFSYFMYSLAGKLVRSGESTQRETMSVDGMTPGIYFIRLNNEKAAHIQKVVIE